MPAACAIGGCADPARKRGWCLFHYDRWRRLGDPLLGGPRRRAPGSSSVLCTVINCAKPAYAADMCSMHYSRKRIHGDEHGGLWHQDGRSKQWSVGKNGYVVRWEPMSLHASSGGLVYQHRQIIGDALGRRLLPSESVHHKNGNRADNRPENLELWVKAQPAGQRVDDLIEFARQILDRYESTALHLKSVAPSIIPFQRKG